LKILQEALRTSIKDIIVTFKPHPDCHLDLNQFPDLPIKVVQNSVGELIKDFKVVFASNRTSAAVEAYIAGCDVIVVKDSYRFNSSPLRGSHAVNFCSTGNEFCKIIDELRDEPNKNQTDVKFFYLDSNLSLWKEHLAN